MLVKTQAIVIHCIKYGDSGIIAHMYTLHYGRISLIIQGVRKKNSRIKMNNLQPLQVLDIDLYYKEKNDLHRIKELRPVVSIDPILVDVRKSAIALFIAEVLYKTLKEHARNENLFSFIAQQINELGQTTKNLSVFHLQFLIDFSLYLGFYPNSDEIQNSNYFNMRDGIFCFNKPGHEFYIAGEAIIYLKMLLGEPVMDTETIKIPAFYRNELLNAMLDYYMLHIESFGNFKSSGILKDIFHS